MERTWNASQFCARVCIAAIGIFCLMACDNGGKIEFRPDTTPRKRNKGSAVTMVPAGKAIITEFGQTPATGHTAKVQINPVQGTELTGGGYTLKLKHTVRNR